MRLVHLVHWIPWSTALLTGIEGERFRRHILVCGVSKYQLVPFCEFTNPTNLFQVCVATITDVMYGYVLIHFDGWEEEFDYWVHHTSTLLHPVGK